MKRFILVLNILGCCLFATVTAFSCTTFVLNDAGQIYFGRSFDFDWGQGWAVINLRHEHKTAFVAQGHLPAEWVSKYGSVTFNQFGQEMPYGGMNEAGLVIEQMAIPESQYPAADSRPEIGMLQWIQYQLDACINVAEVIATDGKIRLEQPSVPIRIHYLVCDNTGDCASIEFLNGKMVCHRGPSLRYHALSNDTYERSAAYVRTNLTSGDKNTFPAMARFACAASRADGFHAKNSEKDVAYALETLDEVRAGNTAWQIVYDVSRRQIHYRTTSNLQLQMLDLKSLNFNDSTPKFADIDKSRSVASNLKFTDMTETELRKYLEAFYAQETFKKAMGDLTPTIEPYLLMLRHFTRVER